MLHVHGINETFECSPLPTIHTDVMIGCDTPPPSRS